MTPTIPTNKPKMIALLKRDDILQLFWESALSGLVPHSYFKLHITKEVADWLQIRGFFAISISPPISPGLAWIIS